MTTIERISVFKPTLLEAFKKMILGINVEITAECRATSHSSVPMGKWFFITEIDADERITIVSQNHYIMSGLKLSDLKLG